MNHAVNWEAISAIGQIVGDAFAHLTGAENNSLPAPGKKR
jgi:hypothetical protein